MTVTNSQVNSGGARNCPARSTPVTDTVKVACEHGRTIDFTSIPGKFQLVPTKQLSPARRVVFRGADVTFWDKLTSHFKEIGADIQDSWDNLKRKVEGAGDQLKFFVQKYTKKEADTALKKKMAYLDKVIINWTGNIPPTLDYTNSIDGQTAQLTKIGSKFELPCMYFHKGIWQGLRNFKVDLATQQTAGKKVGYFFTNFLVESAWDIQNIFTWKHPPTTYTIQGLPGGRSLNIEVYNPEQWKLILSLPPAVSFFAGHSDTKTKQTDGKWKSESSQNSGLNVMSVSTSSYAGDSVEDRRKENLEDSEYWADWFEIIKVECNNSPVKINAIKTIAFIINAVYLTITGILAIVKFAKKTAPEKDFHIDFNMNFFQLSGEIGWGWAEHDDARVKYLVDAKVGGSLIELELEIGWGYQAIGFGATIFGFIKGGLPLEFAFTAVSGLGRRENLEDSNVEFTGGADLGGGIGAKAMAGYILKVELKAELGFPSRYKIFKGKDYPVSGEISLDFTGIMISVTAGIGKGSFLGIIKTSVSRTIQVSPPTRIFKTKIFTNKYPDAPQDMEFGDIKDLILEVLRERRAEDITRIHKDSVDPSTGKVNKGRLIKSFLQKTLLQNLMFWKKAAITAGMSIHVYKSYQKSTLRWYDEIDQEFIADAIARKIEEKRGVKLLHRILMEGKADEIRAALQNKGTHLPYSQKKFYSAHNTYEWECRVQKSNFDTFLNNDVPNIMSTLPNVPPSPPPVTSQTSSSSSQSSSSSSSSSNTRRGRRLPPPPPRRPPSRPGSGRP